MMRFWMAMIVLAALVVGHSVIVLADHVDEHGPVPHSATCDEWIEWLVDGNAAMRMVPVWRRYADRMAMDCLGREAEAWAPKRLPGAEKKHEQAREEGA